MTALQAEPVLSPEPPREPAPATPADRHFSTDHLMADLKGRSVRGGVVTLSAQAAKFVLQLGSTAVLARLLTPADFGLIAMVTAITGFAALFKDLGLSQATIQRDKITHEQVSSLFWINVIASALIGLVVAAVAPLVAWFYGEPRLMWVTIALGGTFIFGGLTAQHTALLRRQMRYMPLAKIEIASLLTGIIVAVAMAFAGADYWALVGMVAGTAAANMVGAWMASGWRPGRLQRRTGLRPMLRFGGNLTGFSALNYLTRNLDNVIIGASLGAGPLGLYSKAYHLLMLPIRQINAPVSAVVLPALSRLQSRPEEYRRFMSRALESLTLASMPLVVLSVVAAPSIVMILMGPDWMAVVPVFRCLAPAALFGTINMVPGWLCGSLGHTERQLHWAAVVAPLTAIAFWIGLGWGIEGVAVAFSATWCVSLLVLIWYAGRGTPFGLGRTLMAIWRPVLASLIAGVATYSISTNLASGISALQTLAAEAGLFGVLYLVCLAVVPGGWDRLTLMSRFMKGCVRGGQRAS